MAEEKKEKKPKKDKAAKAAGEGQAASAEMANSPKPTPRIERRSGPSSSRPDSFGSCT